jgi:triacylglycerol esterase/lipase EstA (alpha/beta hydrolase family)
VNRPGLPGPPAALLVPGWSDTAQRLEHARRHLVAAGWPERQVAVVDFRDRYGSNIDHAAEIADAVARLRQQSAPRQVAVVAHSMGGLALRWYLSRADGAAHVRTAIFVGTPHRGTWAAWLAWGRGGREMRPGSELLLELATSPLPATVRAICIATPIDTRVLPGSSAYLEGAECHTVQRPRHSAMLRHGRTLDLICRLLQQPP